MSTATIAGGAVIIVSLIGAYKTYVYTRRRNNEDMREDIIEQIIVDEPLVPGQYQLNHKNLKWTTIKMTIE